MYAAILYILYALIFILLAFTLTYSVKYRRQRDADMRGLFQARMNICMGGALALLALILLLLIPGTYTSIAVGVIFLLLGLFNLFAGLRNHALYSARRRKP